MRMMIAAAALAACVYAVPVRAEDLRAALTQASFGDRDRATALRRVEAVLAQLGTDRSAEAVLLRATALGYRGRLTNSRSDASAAKKAYEAVIAAQPQNAEAQLGLGAWHLSVVEKAGSLLARVFGANRATGNATLDHAVALGGDHAFYPGLAALMRVKANPADARGRQLIEQASRAGATTQLDRILQRSCNGVLALLRGGKTAEAKLLATRSLPLGSIPGMT